MSSARREEISYGQRLAGLFVRLGWALRRPGRAAEIARWRIKEALFWNRYYARLREPKVQGRVPNDPVIQERVKEELKNRGIRVVDFEIDVADYHRYMERADYRAFPAYCADPNPHRLNEKSLEHYLAARLLDLKADDVYIDIASSYSPAAAIYGRRFGCRTYRQDLFFPEGLQGDTIGGDATRMAIPDGFASKMALHCSFEHFEGDADVRFIPEAARVLRPGGRLCIVPLYLFERYAIQTDPAALPRGGIAFEPDAVLYGARGWSNRHGRHYDIPHFMKRTVANLGGLGLTVYFILNEKAIDSACHAKFAAVFEKPAEPAGIALRPAAVPPAGIVSRGAR
jgi:SAM-dependent methyltransferase